MTKLKPLGGQAIMEGVMIKAPDNVSMACRTPEGKIVTKRDPHHSITKKYKILGLPFFRGMVILFEMMVVGIKALTWSANQQGEEEELGPFEWFITFAGALLLTIGLFVILPYYAAKFFFATTTIAFSVLDGLMRLIVFLLYVFIIGLMKDIKRMFMYHGAEHMSVHCYEHKEELTVKNVSKYPPEHRRCGTNLLFLVIVVSIVTFSFLRSEFWYINVPARIFLIPLVAGVSYEILKVADKYRWLNWLSTPGLWVQKLTTKKPTNDQIEVAIAALNLAKK